MFDVTIYPCWDQNYASKRAPGCYVGAYIMYTCSCYAKLYGNISPVTKYFLLLVVGEYMDT